MNDKPEIKEETHRLGKIERVELRMIWEREDIHFTPWLSQKENLATLGQALDMELELEAIEQHVGPFSADILCKNTDDSALVLIENQLEPTDHRHLGQLMTYAAGLDTAYIVWIASTFTDEHRAALDWLNKITNSDFRFFGLEIELWKIGGSLPAPKFNIVCKPNDWSRAMRDGKNQELGTTQKLYMEFWTGFKEYIEDKNTKFRLRQPQSQNQMTFGIGIGGTRLVAHIGRRTNQIGVRFETIGSRGNEIFINLEKQQNIIEADLGLGPLEWDRLEARATNQIKYSVDGDFNDQNRWQVYYEWILETLEKFDKSFTSKINSID